MKVLIIGNGQIGRAMQEILSPKHEVHIRDVEDYPLSGVDYLHICYPDSLYFVQETRKYIAQYKPTVTIIHSSIGVGKTIACGSHVVHAPIRGRHPHLAKQIPAFPIFVGGENDEDTALVCGYLEGCNLVAVPVKNPMGTELVKLLSNVHMGLEIAWRQEVARILQASNVDPLIYERWEESYNEGYRITDNENLTRPRMRPDPIGGHCILECTDILGKTFQSKAFDFIKESNEKEKTKRNGSHGATRETARV